MSVARAKFLKGDRRRLEYQVWTKWLDSASKLANRFSKATDDDDPFAYNETASVSILASAAHCAGFVALAEFSTDKAAAKGAKSQRRGRSDLWMQADGKSWAFEFKQFNPIGAASPSGRLQKYMDMAKTCADVILRKDADCTVAGLIWPLYWIGQSNLRDFEDRIARAEQRLGQFIEDECDYAWRIDGVAGAPPTYLLFKLVNDYTQ